MASLKPFLKKLGIEPRDLSLYRKAFTHISVAETPSDSYERLEFLGDSVIGLVISAFIYNQFEDKEEGGLSRVRANIVSRESLGEKAQELGLGKFVRADTVRMREGKDAEISILGDCFESLVGAIFADRGYLAARKFILTNLRQDCLDLSEMEGPSDYKSRLQELWQHKYKDIPDYRVISEKGPDHSKTFTVEVRYRRKKLGRGTGSSKKRAEQEAARAAYESAIAGEGKKRRKKTR
jgi:ribonuclease-3